MISTRLVLEVYAIPLEERLNMTADQMICEITKCPPKIAWAAMEREERRGYLDCGTNLRLGWLTRAGEWRLGQLKEPA